MLYSRSLINEKWREKKGGGKKGEKKKATGKDHSNSCKFMQVIIQSLS